MNINLVLASGLVYTLLGALIMFLSHRALYVRATRIVAGYPRVLAALKMQRHDGRFGLTMIACGSLLQILAACGYTLPLAHWQFPFYVAVAAIAGYGLWRYLAARPVATAARASRARLTIRRVYETRRSTVLLEAARREAATRRAREAAKGERDRSVVYVAKEADCRWWSDRLGVTPEVLRAAVRQVGPMVKDLERYLAREVRPAGHALAA